MKTFQWLSADHYQQRLTNQQWRDVLTAYSFAILPLLFYIAQPLGSLLIFAVLIKWLSHWQNWRKPPILFLFLLIPIGITLIIIQIRNIGITYSFVALLTLMSTAKMLESRNIRDCRILFLISQTLSLCFLMYSQSITIFLYLLGVIALSYHTLIRLNQRQSQIIVLSSWKAISKLILIALPITAILFFTFPRINPIWGLPQPNSQAITGLPNEMSLGDIGRLAQSNEIAYHVQFHDTRPTGAQLYWRALVLWTYTGTQWLQSPADAWKTPEPLKSTEQNRIHYTITLAKPELEWLPTLDMTIDKPKRIPRIGYAHQIRLPRLKNQSEAQFTLTATTNYQLGEKTLSANDRKNATQLPPGINLSQTRALARQLYQQGGNTTEGFAQNFLNYIRQNEYYYTLEPYPGSGDIETFLFSTRTGFCEHYANAMAVSARTIGIPARIVIGYQGGETNPLTGDLVVREENAHAWVEIWQDNNGWTRYDPTAAVAPYRIESARLSSRELSGKDTRNWTTRMAEKYTAAIWIRNAIDASQTFWQNWIINLNSNRQTSLLGEFGLGGYGKAMLFFLGLLLIILVTAILWLYYQRKQRPQLDPLAQTAEKLLKKLGTQGFIRREHESLADFLRRLIAENRSPNPTQYQQAADAYETARYRDPMQQSHAIHILKKI